MVSAEFKFNKFSKVSTNKETQILPDIQAKNPIDLPGMVFGAKSPYPTKKIQLLFQSYFLNWN